MRNLKASLILSDLPIPEGSLKNVRVEFYSDNLLNNRYILSGPDLGTYATGDGVPPGKYRISIAWNAPGDFGDEEGESLLPLRYLDPATSGLPEVEVLKDSVTLPPFHLTLN